MSHAKRIGFLSLAFCLLFSSSCANLSKNFVKEGSLALRGGVYQSTSWNDRLQFNRTSWFQELTLIFEVLSTDGKEVGPFESWYSTQEIQQVRACDKFTVILVYASDSGKISESSFFSELRAQGYERISIPEFGSHLRMHPDFERLALHLYRPYGLCLRQSFTAESVPPTLSFPGFREVKL